MDIKNEQPLEKAILEVAERLFLEKGFAMTSTTEIAKEVGCNQALVHYYFRTKENLFNIIFEQKFRFFFQWILNMKDMEGLTFQEKLRRLIETHYDILTQNPKMPSLILNEFSRRPEQLTVLIEKLRAIPEQAFSEMNKELQLEIEKGTIRNISLKDIIISMLSLNLSLFLMMPVAEKVLQADDTQKKLLIDHRRSENVEFILKSLRP